MLLIIFEVQIYILVISLSTIVSCQVDSFFFILMENEHAGTDPEILQRGGSILWVVEYHNIFRLFLIAFKEKGYA